MCIWTYSLLHNYIASVILRVGKINCCIVWTGSRRLYSHLQVFCQNTLLALWYRYQQTDNTLSSSLWVRGRELCREIVLNVEVIVYNRHNQSTVTWCCWGILTGRWQYLTSLFQNIRDKVIYLPYTSRSKVQRMLVWASVFLSVWLHVSVQRRVLYGVLSMINTIITVMKELIPPRPQPQW